MMFTKGIKMFVFRCTRDGCGLLFPTLDESLSHSETEQHCEMCQFSTRNPLTPLNIHEICEECKRDLNRRRDAR